MLHQEKNELRAPPSGAWGFTSCIVPAAGDPNFLGNRALFHGGWNSFGSMRGVNHRYIDPDPANAERDNNFTNCIIVLDCEHVIDFSTLIQ